MDRLSKHEKRKEHLSWCECRESGPGNVRDCNCGYSVHNQAISICEAWHDQEMQRVVAEKDASLNEKESCKILMRKISELKVEVKQLEEENESKLDKIDMLVTRVKELEVTNNYHSKRSEKFIDLYEKEYEKNKQIKESREVSVVKLRKTVNMWIREVQDYRIAQQGNSGLADIMYRKEEDLVNFINDLIPRKSREVSVEDMLHIFLNTNCDKRTLLPGANDPIPPI